MEQRLTIITLGVQDLHISANFYEKTLGWTRLKQESDGIIFFQLNGILLSLFPAEELAKDAGVNPYGSGFRKFSLAYNAESKTMVDSIFTKLKARGVTITKEPENVFWGGYSGYFSDPDGHLWEVAYNPFLPLDQDGNVVKSSDT